MSDWRNDPSNRVAIIAGAVLFVIIVFSIGMLLFATRVPAQPAPLPKMGSCPSGYSSGANYCSPMSGAKVCVVKQGQCPGSTVTSGNYCCVR